VGFQSNQHQVVLREYSETPLGISLFNIFNVIHSKILTHLKAFKNVVYLPDDPSINLIARDLEPSQHIVVRMQYKIILKYYCTSVSEALSTVHLL
jgi:hypothetical protein